MMNLQASNIQKIFCIGAHKTGTTTLERCLKILGFGPHAGWNQSHFLIPDWATKNYPRILEYSTNFRSFSDSPWNHTDIYKILNQGHPNSKFILSIRDPEAWFTSFQRWMTPVNKTHTSIKTRKYGTLFHSLAYNNTSDSLENQQRAYIEIYSKRNQDIIDYFKGYSDFISLDITKNPRWEELCNFLQVPLPKASFPHLNKGKTT